MHPTSFVVDPKAFQDRQIKISTNLEKYNEPRKYLR
ncbi:hypothetical protein Lbys_0526 [Leadbetterella byssophila DSM 17132]|uniref:Uncharacterized protein n=1 Tax=Leadbetterella byssophila (strain DSM 17132 / JCM 16389 / KACC 11308 / NBRC 106382 / 4M15) TaxID=649349 RepID=E4RXF2_LEAB4|nr:hypothetical protein Lbys_0526 [Leadbetterella byssophila DSM 17132]